MESADQDTRRRAAMELVKGLSKLYEQQVMWPELVNSSVGH